MVVQRSIFALVLASMSMPLAQAEQLPSGAKAALENFYHNFNGDRWRNNEGWLDADVPPCDWFGVRCGTPGGQFGIVSLRLPDNGLEGPLDGTGIFGHVMEDVELPRNRIHGSLTELPYWLDRLDLSDNRITGSLPPGPPSQVNALDHLDLARNRIGGGIPSDWSLLGLDFLDLSNNRLEGSLEPLAHAGSWQSPSFMNLADNRFQGRVTRMLMDGRFYGHNEGTWGGGINLCWNDLEVPHSGMHGMHDWMAAHHVGGETLDLCLDRARDVVGPETSGSWSDPARTGEGAVLQVLRDGRVANFMFGFDNQGRQHWLVGVGEALDRTFHWRRLVSERGTFGEGAVEQPVPPVDMLPRMGWGRNWRLDRVGPRRFVIERTYEDASHCQDGSSMLCFGDTVSDRLEYRQLSRLAGTTCGNRHRLQWISGAWYDPSRDGEGFVVEVLSDGRGVVYWFTFRPDDSQHQAWMTGIGEFDGQTLHVDDLIQPVGGEGWGGNFNPASVDDPEWGSLTMEFSGDGTAHVRWNSVMPEYGSGDYSIERLTAPRLAECGGR